jgi:hypothetical protein
LQDRLSAGKKKKIEDITAPFEPTPLEEPVVEDAPVDPAPTQTKPKKTKTAVVKDVLPDTADTVDSNVPNN